MIVISKKRIQIIILCVMVSILTVVLQVKGNTKEIQNTNSDMNNGKTVILDAGHGIPDVGVILLGK